MPLKREKREAMCVLSLIPRISLFLLQKEMIFFLFLPEKTRITETRRNLDTSFPFHHLEVDKTIPMVLEVST